MKIGAKIGICMGATLLSALTAALFPILLYPLLAFTAFMGAYWSVGFSLPCALAVIAGTVFSFGTGANSAASALAYLLSIVVMTVYLKKRFAHRYAVLSLAVIFCLGQYLAFTLEAMLAGRPPYSDTMETWSELTQTLTPVLDGAAGSGFTAETLGSVTLLIPDLLMWICILFAEAYSFGCVMLLRLFRRLFKEDQPAMARIAEWRLPANALWGSLILLAGIPIAYLLRLQQANSIAYSIGLIVASLFCVQGMAYLTFVFTVSRAPKAVRVLSWILPFFAFPYSMGLLALIGIKEQITKKRPKIKAYLKELNRQKRHYDRADELAKYGYIREEKPDESVPGNEDGPDNDNEKNDGAPRADT